MLRLIHPSELHSVWPIVRDGLSEVANRNHVDWIQEDVYHAIKSGGSALHLSEDGSFLVTCLNQNVYTGNRELHIWVARSCGNGDIIDEGLELLRSMARNSGAVKITFDSPRKGWERRYNLITAVYEVPL